MTPEEQLSYQLLFQKLSNLLPHQPPYKQQVETLSEPHLKWMICTCQENLDNWSISKLNRWIGWIQAGLYIGGKASMDELKELSRLLGTKNIQESTTYLLHLAQVDDSSPASLQSGTLLVGGETTTVEVTENTEFKCVPWFHSIPALPTIKVKDFNASIVIIHNFKSWRVMDKVAK